MINEFSGTLAKYEVSVGDERIVTMQGDVEHLDKIVAQMKAHKPMYEALTRIDSVLDSMGGDIPAAITEGGHDKIIKAALEAARGK